MGDRTAFQAAEAELPPALLLRRKRQCHQDTDMDSPDSQSTADGHAEAYQPTVELLGIVNYYTFLENPERDWAKMLEETREIPPEPTLFD